MRALQSPKRTKNSRHEKLLQLFPKKILSKTLAKNFFPKKKKKIEIISALNNEQNGKKLKYQKPKSLQESHKKLHNDVSLLQRFTKVMVSTIISNRRTNHFHIDNPISHNKINLKFFFSFIVILCIFLFLFLFLCYLESFMFGKKKTFDIKANSQSS